MIENCINDNNDNLDLVCERFSIDLFNYFFLIVQVIKSLLLDSILALRLRLLTSTMANNDQKIPYLNDFQQELDHYKQLNQMMKLPKQRV